MNILVTGGLGHLGSNFTRNISIPCSLSVVDNLLTQRYCSLFNVQRHMSFLDKGIAELSEQDLRGIDVIVHFAAIADAVGSLYAKELVQRTNVTETMAVIDLARISGVKLFVFPSTTSVYGGPSQVMFEDDESNIEPQSPYAESKVTVEKYLRQSGMTHVIVRFGTIFGFSQGMRFHTAINKFCYQAALGKELTIWQSHLGLMRPYLGLNDCLQALEMVITKSEMWNMTYNVITSNYGSSEVVDCIRQVKEVSVRLCESPLPSQASYRTSIDRIAGFGFVPKDDLKTEVSRMMEVFSGVIK